MENIEEKSLEILKRYWGYDAFRPMQQEIISSVLQGRDTLGLLPTEAANSEKSGFYIFPLKN